MRWIILAGIAAALLAGVWFGGQAYWKSRFYPAPPAFTASSTGSVADRRAQDAEALAAFAGLNRAFSDEQRRAFESGQRQLAARARETSAAEFELDIMRLLALGNNGHTNLLPWPFLPQHSYRLAPVRFYRFADGIYVVRAIKGFEALLGARLTAVGGRPVAEVDKVLRPYIGGVDAFYRLMSPALLERTALLHAAGLGGSITRADMTFLMPDGKEQVVRVPGLVTDYEPYRRKASDYLSPERLSGEPADWWRSVVAEVPPAFREPEKGQLYLEDSGRSVAYVRIRINMGPDLKTFTEETIRAVKKLRPKTLIADMRFNSGGDYTQSSRLMRALPGALGKEGHVYILTGPETFSAGIYSVAFLREAAKGRSTIIGEPMGDSGRFWSEGGFLFLPNTRFALPYNTAMHDVENGCYDVGRCYWLNLLYPVAAGPLDVETQAPLNFADYIRGRDLAMETALRQAGVDPAQVRLSAP